MEVCLLGALVADLCGPGYDMITGATIPVDGGWRISRF
jgi:NAD(P)-dependent dehydrogenase (short-subunit alcohol dehydrogenase family)